MQTVPFRMKPAFVTRTGAKRTHTPDPEQLKGTGLQVAEEQPHIAAGEEHLAENWKPQSPDPWKDEAELKPKQKRRPRMPRAKISATKPDGSIPTTLGGKLPPVSVLARREFGLRALRR